MTTNDCLICQKQENLSAYTGEVIAQRDGWVLTHFPYGLGENAIRGHLVLETRRHIQDFTDLTDDEAAALGGLIKLGSRAIKTILQAEHVYAFRINDKVAHLHVHLVPRYPGTPKEHWGLKITAWPDRPTVTLPEIQSISRDLQRSLG